MAVPQRTAADSPPRKGSGWLAFAATMLIVSGVFKVFDAFWAFKYDNEISPRVQTVVFEHDLASWGWVWLVVGVILILAGFAVFGNAQWARWVGFAAATIAMIAAVPWIYFEPLWTVLTVTLASFVLYALAAYGGPESSWMDDV